MPLQSQSQKGKYQSLEAISAKGEALHDEKGRALRQQIGRPIESLAPDGPLFIGFGSTGERCRGGGCGIAESSA
jgi:hypothetical protein